MITVRDDAVLTVSRRAAVRRGRRVLWFTNTLTKGNAFFSFKNSGRDDAELTVSRRAAVRRGRRVLQFANPPTKGSAFFFC